MSIRKGNDIIASKPLIDAVPTQSSTNAVSSGGVYDALATKQATISDLATIRSGAAAGATAVQPATLASYVTLATAQTISGVKTFSSELHSTNNITFDSAQATPIIRGMSGANYRNMIVRTNSSSSIDVGNPNDTINLKGSATNPTYNGNNLALYSDLPTVNNPTITLTQGGVTKGSFTLNQASGDTIDFDAGGGSGLPSQTGQAGKFLTTDGTDASWSDKPLVNSSTKTNALAIGSNSAAGNYTTSIGSAAYSSLSTYGLCAGYNSASTGAGSVALGAGAHASALHSIQISSAGSTSAYNNDANTFKVANANGNFEIMSADGTIPEARLADTTSAAQGQVLTLDSNLDATWATPTSSVIAFQEPNAGNNYTWYRKYADGWVEQGGITNAISVTGNTGANVDITLPITMADTNYNVLTTRKDGGSGFAQTEENTNIVSTSVIRIGLWNNISGTASAGKFWWQVSGMAA